jgi:BlaI family transcriptional regulator, penicillinase repressor
MARPPAISDAEWDIMRVLWDRERGGGGGGGGATAQDVADDLAARRRWSPQTVKTLLARLVKKGAVTAEPQGRRFVYRPRVSRAAAVRAEGRSFVSRVFGGAVAPAVIHFVKTGRLSEAEIAELRRVLDGEAPA